MKYPHSRWSYATYDERCDALIKATYDRLRPRRHARRAMASFYAAQPGPIRPCAETPNAQLSRALGILDLVYADTTGPAAGSLTGWAASLDAVRDLIGRFGETESNNNSENTPC